jgi:hypothetical protein
LLTTIPVALALTPFRFGVDRVRPRGAAEDRTRLAIYVFVASRTFAKDRFNALLTASYLRDREAAARRSHNAG